MKTLLATFNTITYTGLGFQAMEFSHAAVLFLVVPVVVASVALIVALNSK